MAKLTSRQRNRLPDSAFLLPKVRKLPYKNANGTVSLSHVRNALARANQVVGVPQREINAAIRKAETILLEHGGYERNDMKEKISLVAPLKGPALIQTDVDGDPVSVMGQAGDIPLDLAGNLIAQYVGDSVKLTPTGRYGEMRVSGGIAHDGTPFEYVAEVTVRPRGGKKRNMQPNFFKRKPKAPPTAAEIEEAHATQLFQAQAQGTPNRSRDRGGSD
jgi:hypothetical protein